MSSVGMRDFRKPIGGKAYVMTRPLSLFFFICVKPESDWDSSLGAPCLVIRPAFINTSIEIEGFPKAL